MKIYVNSKFSCVRSSHNLCVHAHAHSLEGALVSALWCHGKDRVKYRRDKVSVVFRGRMKLCTLTWREHREMGLSRN